MNMKRDTTEQATQIWRQRKAIFNKEALGYWAYVLRSNFVGYMFLLLIVGIYYYVKVLGDLPTDYPYWWIVMLVLVPLLAMGSIRTFIVQPDRMFLLPLEGQLSGYFRLAFRYSMTIHSIRLIFGLLAVWPLYLHCKGAEAQPIWLVIGLLLLAKWAVLLSNWQESKLVSRQARQLSALFRWIAALAMIPIAFIYGVMWAALLLIIVALCWIIALRLIRQHTTGWETLIEREQTSRRRHYRFFAMFIDVTPLPPTVRKRGILSLITNMYRFHSSNTHLYLFTKTWLRTDLFSMFLRTTIAAFFIAIVVSSDGVRTAILVIGAFISALQLTTLRDTHRYTFWLQMYPIPVTKQVGAVLAIMQTALTAQAILFALTLLLRTANPLYAVAPIIMLLLCVLYFRLNLHHKWTKDMLSD
ncbi:ABC transporter permease [Paenibacillus albiflavus]|uniref:ABC transporter permease n=1 Tax=Paenibacillus albiflavus TaxID=2545760 RepID=A0A4R4E083_9BACL|nr:ABC transporter permease [Paenibacillus albiflavus]TCZ70545.1 ABC transporter permease [Paenibacillus albiflavus]